MSGKPGISRRSALKAAAVTGAALPFVPLPLVLEGRANRALGSELRLAPTPVQTKGPFYPPALPLDSDADLVRVTGRDAAAQGRVAHLIGDLIDPHGRPVPGARIEIWQCDALGRYHHPRDSGARDEGFQGFGKTVTDAQGRWRFRTIEPVPYAPRTPHIHMQVLAPGWAPLVTQLYMAGHPLNAGDFVRRRLSRSQASRVTSGFHPAPEIEPDALAAVFQIVLGATPRQE